MNSNFRRGFDYIGVSAVALIHDGHKKLLLQQRGPKARDEQGHWDLCGGAVEFGETIEDTIRREVKEELSADVINMKFLTVYDAHRVSAKQPTHWVAIVYAVQIDPKKLRIGEPHKISQVGWFTSASLPSPLHSQFQKSLQCAIEQHIIL